MPPRRRVKELTEDEGILISEVDVTKTYTVRFDAKRFFENVTSDVEDELNSGESAESVTPYVDVSDYLTVEEL